MANCPLWCCLIRPFNCVHGWNDQALEIKKTASFEWRLHPTSTHRPHERPYASFICLWCWVRALTVMPSGQWRRNQLWKVRQSWRRYGDNQESKIREEILWKDAIHILYMPGICHHGFGEVQPSNATSYATDISREDSGPNPCWLGSWSRLAEK